MKLAPRDGGITPRRAVLLFVAVMLAGCHSSCTEETGAEPVVDTSEASTPIGAPHKVTDRTFRYPGTVPVRTRPMGVTNPSAAPSNSE